MTGTVWLFGAAVILMAIGLYQGIKTAAYQVKTPKLSAGQTVRLLLLSDLHSKRKGKKQSKIMRICNQLHPDAVMLVGDIIEAAGDMEPAFELVRGLMPKSPVFYVTGNHDLFTFNCCAFKCGLEALGVTVLSGQTAFLQVRGQELALSGVEDLFMGFIKAEQDQTAYYLRCVNEAAPKDPNHFSILLAHRPEFIDAYQNAGFDLALCGHSHGGQIRLPFIMNGLYASGQGLFPKYAGGMYHRESLTEIVGRGLHTSFFRPRFFNRPEVVVIDLIGEG